MSVNQEKVGKVTEQEKYEVMKLHERKLGLMELLPVVETMQMPQEERERFYNKIVQDLGNTKRNLEAWWRSKAEHYQWKSLPDGSWNIDFQTNVITLNR